MTLRTLLNSPLLRLSTAERYSGIYLSRKDSVSDHTTQVGLLGLLISNDLRKLDVDVDLAQVALKSLTHDIDESITCDVPRNVKYFNDGIREALDEISDKSVLKISQMHDFPELYNIWINSKDKSLEGFIVKISDMVHVIVKLREELVILGNLHMLKVLIEIDGHLTAINEYVNSDRFSFSAPVKQYFAKLLSESLDTTSSLKINYQTQLELLDITTQVITEA